MNPYKRGKSQNYIGTGNRGHRPQQEPLMLWNGNEQPQQYQQPRPKIKKGTFGKKFNKK
jgi:hypothetical protein